ncbi:MAG: hypothetical protein KDA69_01780 [Planctomycetaceae bacterium]|nr:hypothetical protein [Planctomycetaceae bacterium]MCA9043017.1 hypothetical protein [Planctomycetaceae bacterium]
MAIQQLPATHIDYAIHLVNPTSTDRPWPFDKPGSRQHSRVLTTVWRRDSGEPGSMLF